MANRRNNGSHLRRLPHPALLHHGGVSLRAGHAPLPVQEEAEAAGAVGAGGDGREAVRVSAEEREEDRGTGGRVHGAGIEG